ncbi:MAG: FGGY-family carbohydrate kinase [Suipraeoptans sp.]
MKYFIGIDNGGTFVKAGVVDRDGNLIATAKEPVHNIKPQPGYVERDMEELWQQNVKVIKQAVVSSGVSVEDILGISFSGHGKGLYLIGKDGKPLYNGILSTDTRAWEEVEEWKKDGTAKKIYEKTLQDILPCQPVSLLAWLNKNEPVVFEEMKYIFSVNDYIRFRMTGIANAEYTNFSSGNLINFHTLDYDIELLRSFGLESTFSKLPPLKHSAEICGGISEQVASLTGLKEGTAVVAGMFDVDACAIATGISDDTTICMIAGTWSINEYISHQPIADGTVSLNSLFCIPDYFLIEESSPTSAGNMQWFIDEMLGELNTNVEDKSESIYTLINKWVEEVEPEKSNIVFLPFLNGSNEDSLARGSFVGITEYHNRKHILRAIYEGIVFSHLTHLKRLLKNREKPSAIRLAGGVANSKVWVQIFADVLQMDIETVECREQGIIGAMMAASIGVGVYKNYGDVIHQLVQVSQRITPRREYSEVYEKKYRNYRTVVEALSDVWAKMEREMNND